MPSIRLVLNVSESVYQGFVLPQKQQKSLNKSVIGLMESYVHDEYVRARIDGDLKGAANEAIEELKDTLKGVWSATDAEVAFGSATARAGIESFQREIDSPEETDTKSSESPVGVSQSEIDGRFDALDNRIAVLTGLLEKLVVQGLPVAAPVVASVAPSVTLGSGVHEQVEQRSAARAWPEAETKEKLVVESEPVKEVPLSNGLMGNLTGFMMVNPEQGAPEKVAPKAKVSIDEDVEESEVKSSKTVKAVPPKAEEADDEAKLDNSEQEDIVPTPQFATAMLGFGTEFNIGGL